MFRQLEERFDNIFCWISHWINKEEFNRLREEKGDYSLVGFDQLKCIYIHIPKAAGISVNKAIFGNYGGGHKKVHAYKRIFGPSIFQDYFKITFVRNPYSRLLSAFHFLRNGGFNERDRNWATKNLSGLATFDEFVTIWLNEETIWSYTHFHPQYSFVCDIDLNPEVDFIGKVETINKDFDKVCNILQIENILSVYNNSKKDNSNWRRFYTEDSLAKVARLYHHDFEIFNYDPILKRTASGAPSQ